jgi:hypothetical protein
MFRAVQWISVVEIASLLTDLPPTFTLVEANRRFLFRGTYSAQVRAALPSSADDKKTRHGRNAHMPFARCTTDKRQGSQVE